MQNLIKTLFLVFISHLSIAQFGINTDGSPPHSSAQLDVKSTTKAFYPPRMTTGQKNAIVSPQAGATVYDITLGQLSFYNGSSWVAASGGGLSLPYNQAVSQFTGYDGGLFKVTNTLPTISGEAVAINGTITGGDGFAIRAMATNTNGSNTAAIYATNSSTNSNGQGVFGSHAGGGSGIYGSSTSGFGVLGSSQLGTGVKAYGKDFGVSASSAYGIGVSGESLNASGKGVIGIANGSFSTGVRGETSGTDSKGVYGYANGSEGVGVRGYSLYYTGVQAESNNGIGLYASSVNNYAIITNFGNVGIGVSAPTTILDIKSRMRIRHSNETSGIYLDGTTNTYEGFVGLETDNLTGIYGFNGAAWAVKMDNTTGEWLATKGLSVGGGSKMNKIIRAAVPFDIPSVSAGGVLSLAFPVADAQVGDQVLVSGSGNLYSVVFGNCFVSVPGNVNVFFINGTNTAYDAPLMTYYFTLIR
jgi:hypothetical protein